MGRGDRVVDIRVRQVMNFDSTVDTAHVFRVLRVDHRYYVHVTTTPYTTEWTLATAVNAAVAQHLSSELSDPE